MSFVPVNPDLARLVVAQWPEALWLMDLERRTTWTSPAVEAQWGWSPQALLGRPFDDRMAPDSRAVAGAALDAPDDGGVARFEAEYLCADGGTRWAETIAKVLRDDDGRASGWLCAARDITARRAAAAEEAWRQARLGDTQWLAGQAAAAGGVAHVFNNSLAVIVLNTEMALAELDAHAAAHPFVEAIGAATHRAGLLVRQMLALSEHGRMAAVPVELAVLVSANRELLAATVPDHVTLVLDMAPELPTITADPTQLLQGLLNLVVNSVEALGAGHGTITVRCQERDVPQDYLDHELPHRHLTAGRYLILAVEDDGPGMTRDTESRALHAFFSTKGPGRGLGLAAVTGIARGHGGFVHLDGLSGHGTLAEMAIPVPAPREPAVEATAAPAAASATRAVLVIDDESSVRDLTGRMLVALGYTALLADGGAAGLAVYTSHAPDIVAAIVDLTMPGMDGRAVCRELRARGCAAPILISTGYAPPDAEIIACGANGLLAKPYRLAALRAALAGVTA